MPIGAHLTDYINGITGWTGTIFIPMGLLHLIAIEHQNLIRLFRIKKSRWQYLGPILYRLLYIPGGLLLIILSYSLTTFIGSVLLDGISSSFDPTYGPNAFFAWLHENAGFSGQIVVAGFILTGLIMIISAGGRWLVNLAKLTATVTVIYMLVAGFFA